MKHIVFLTLLITSINCVEEDTLDFYQLLGKDVRDFNMGTITNENSKLPMVLNISINKQKRVDVIEVYYSFDKEENRDKFTDGIVTKYKKYDDYHYLRFGCELQIHKTNIMGPDPRYTVSLEYHHSTNIDINGDFIKE